MSLGRLLQRLSDGEFHSGEALGAELAVSRTAVWKQLRKLEELGLVLESVRGKGYRLPGGLELLEVGRVRASLDAAAARLITDLDVLDSVESTNGTLLARAARGSALRGVVCTAEHQVAGRGRRGRHWVSPYGRNLYVSVGWEFMGGAAALEGLSLAVGTAVTTALCEHGVQNAVLKWPNDVLVDGRKLAGVLLEMAGDASGRCQVVVGVGINVSMPPRIEQSIDQPWIDATTAAGLPLSRNGLLGSLLNRLLPLLEQFERQGFGPFRDAWSQLDAFRGKPVSLLKGDAVIPGIAAGVDHTGALLLDTPNGRQAFFGGEISLRGDA